MAGEIQLNSTTMATESSGSITAELDTIRPNTNNGSLTLQGDSSGSGVTGLTIDSSGNATFAGTGNNLGTVTAGTIGSSVVFPTGHIVQVKRDKSAETNTLTTSYQTNAFYDLGITLKTNSPDIWWVLNTSYYATQSFGVQIRVSTSSPVTSSDTLIWDEQTSNSTGPSLAGHSNASYGVISLNSIYESTASIGDTLYFGFFARLYSTGTVQISASAASPVTQGTIAFTLIEVQG